MFLTGRYAAGLEAAASLPVRFAKPTCWLPGDPIQGGDRSSSASSQQELVRTVKQGLYEGVMQWLHLGEPGHGHLLMQTCLKQSSSLDKRAAQSCQSAPDS